MTTKRVTQDELDDLARHSKFKLQAQEAVKFLDAGWRCYNVRESEGARVVFLQHPQSGKNGVTIAAVYPNGRVIRNPVGRKTLTYNWSDVIAAAKMQEVA